MGDVQFRLLDVGTEAPLSGAGVSLIASGGATYSGTTDGGGSRTWTGVPSGYASVTITKTGYIFDTPTFSTIYVTPDQMNTFVRYGQSPPTTAELTVLHDESALPSRTVTLKRAGVVAASGVTNASGKVTFGNLLVGTYTVDVDYPSHVENPSSIEITRDNYHQPLALTIRMEDAQS